LWKELNTVYNGGQYSNCVCKGHMEWNGMEWNGMEWNGIEWNGMYYYRMI
jgi:hypothetical protein